MNIEVGDWVRILATETQLAKHGLSSPTCNWLINGCDKEVVGLAENTRIYLKDRHGKMFWLYAEMVQLMKKHTGQK